MNLYILEEFSYATVVIIAYDVDQLKELYKTTYHRTNICIDKEKCDNYKTVRNTLNRKNKGQLLGFFPEIYLIETFKVSDDESPGIVSFTYHE